MNSQSKNPAIVVSSQYKWLRVVSVVVIALIFSVVMRSTMLWAAPVAAPAASNLAQSQPSHGGDDDDHDDDDHDDDDHDDDDHDDDKPGDDDWDDDYDSRYGVIASRPVENVGVWVIGSKSYSVTESTVLEGVLDAGVCVEVKVLESAPTVAVKIQAKEAFKCNGGDDDDNDDDDDGDDDDHLERYGLVESRPEGKVGVWVIGGKSYTATAQTELDFDYGPLTVGSCAKVKEWVAQPGYAKEIESEKSYKCGERPNGEARGTIFGVIEQLPADLQNGTWLIGGMSFVVSPTTEIVTKGIVITPGLTVKVEFTTNISDTNFARSIEVKFSHNNSCRDDNRGRGDDDGNRPSHNGDDDWDDDHRYGNCPGSEGRAVALIDSRPTDSLVGEWVIGGVPYVTNAQTKFLGNDFLVGQRVNVDYVVVSGSGVSETVRLATKIKETNSNGGVGNPNNSLIVGYVDAKPTAFIGSWTINGAPFEAISTTVFIERGSLFAVGSYVVVEYEIVNDVRVISKILTYVPPGAGDDDRVGKVESIEGAVMSASADASLQSAEVWTIDGVQYIVTEATQLVDGGSELATGATVFVNSYTADGQQYATMIRAQAGAVYIPSVSR